MYDIIFAPKKKHPYDTGKKSLTRGKCLFRFFPNCALLALSSLCCYYHCCNDDDGQESRFPQGQHKKTGSSVTKAIILSNQKLKSTMSVAMTTAVTQTQDDEIPQVPITTSPQFMNPLSALVSVTSCLLSTLNSSVADGDAISDMSLGQPFHQLDYTGATGATVEPLWSHWSHWSHWNHKTPNNSRGVSYQ
jgi:hypothetical protein